MATPSKTLRVNGQSVSVSSDPSTPLLWVLREELGLTGTKFGCGIAQCGACTVHIDGQAIRACVYPLTAVSDKQSIVTIEGLSEDGSHPVQQAWTEFDVPQCGYCQPGMIMASAALLANTPKPTDDDIDRSITNICRCGTFQRVRKGIHRAAELAYDATAAHNPDAAVPAGFAHSGTPTAEGATGAIDPAIDQTTTRGVQS